MSKLQNNLSVLETFDAQPAKTGAKATTKTYLNLLMQRGLMEGVGEHASIDTQAREVLSALHHILAGGQVHIDVTTPGAQERYHELEEQCDQAAKDASTTYQGPPIAVAAP